jgi:hypothetical protein
MEYHFFLSDDTTQDLLSKRGFICLGRLILFGSSDKSEIHDVVEYHFFLSDNTTQDLRTVNFAKE